MYKYSPRLALALIVVLIMYGRCIDDPETCTSDLKCTDSNKLCTSTKANCVFYYATEYTCNKV